MENKDHMLSVMGFTSDGMSRMFNRTTDPKKPTQKELARGRVRRDIEDILEQRKIETDYSY